jgi:putative hydrolase of the HAD superfamily
MNHMSTITPHAVCSMQHAARYTHLLFDLDETLYPRNTGLMQEIGRRIVRYLNERAGFSPEEAEQLRKHFLNRYGTTLRGLQIEHHVDTDDYLRFVHDVRLEDYIAPNAALDAMLRRMALPKAIFTNADERHARRVLARLGVAEHFPFILDIRAMQFCNKPDPLAYESVLRALRVDGPDCILIEDSVRNLRPAKELFGMTTVLVGGNVEAGVDIAISDLLELEGVIETLNHTGER